MFFRPSLAGLFAALALSTGLLFSGCSSSKPRDVHYGTDADVGFIPPDAPAATTTYDAGIDGGSAMDSGIDGNAASATDSDVSADTVSAVDAAVSVDTAVDGDS
jgi:hypothetical protein